MMEIYEFKVALVPNMTTEHHTIFVKVSYYIEKYWKIKIWKSIDNDHRTWYLPEYFVCGLLEEWDGFAERVAWAWVWHAALCASGKDFLWIN